MIFQKKQARPLLTDCHEELKLRNLTLEKYDVHQLFIHKYRHSLYHKKGLASYLLIKNFLQYKASIFIKVYIYKTKMRLKLSLTISVLRQLSQINDCKNFRYLI